jgi:DNA-directed RNA polymerase specialized sigma24 family protein
MADDISQEVLVLLLASPPPRDLRTYVPALSRRLALGHLRAERRRLARERAWVDGPDDRAPASGADRFLSPGFMSSSPKERLLLEMLAAGFTVREIAERSGRPKSSVQRDIKVLRSDLSKAGLRGTAALRAVGA